MRAQARVRQPRRRERDGVLPALRHGVARSSLLSFVSASFVHHVVLVLFLLLVPPSRSFPTEPVSLASSRLALDSREARKERRKKLFWLHAARGERREGVRGKTGTARKLCTGTAGSSKGRSSRAQVACCCGERDEGVSSRRERGRGGRAERARTHLLDPLLRLRAGRRARGSASTSARGGEGAQGRTFLVNWARSVLYTSAIEATSASSAAGGERSASSPKIGLPRSEEQGRTVGLLQKLDESAQDCRESEGGQRGEGGGGEREKGRTLLNLGRRLPCLGLRGASGSARARRRR